MAGEDRRRWNERYRRGSFSDEPAGIVTRYHELAPAGRALDLAAGNGRHARFLVDRGFTVDALDISEVGLAPLVGYHPRLHPVCIDLDTVEIPEERYSLIVNIRYLSRRLFPYIRAGLAPGGVLIFESYLEGGDPGARPSCRDYLLRTNELLHAFLSLTVRFYQEAPAGPEPSPVASLVAVRRR